MHFTLASTMFGLGACGPLNMHVYCHGKQMIISMILNVLTGFARAFIS